MLEMSLCHVLISYCREKKYKFYFIAVQCKNEKEKFKSTMTNNISVLLVLPYSFIGVVIERSCQIQGGRCLPLHRSLEP